MSDFEVGDYVRDLVEKSNPILKQKTERFNFSNPPIDPVLLARMLAETMIKNGGIGLAAPQIGLPYRAFALRTNPVMVCFNPLIADLSTEQIELEEGCLTFPGLILKIKRPSMIRARYTLPNGETKTDKFIGMTARAFLHEMDHLDGVLFTSHVGKVALELAKNKAKKRKAA